MEEWTKEPDWEHGKGHLKMSVTFGNTASQKLRSSRKLRGEYVLWKTHQKDLGILSEVICGAVVVRGVVIDRGLALCKQDI